jgi:hypothetical protein
MCQKGITFFMGGTKRKAVPCQNRWNRLGFLTRLSVYNQAVGSDTI